MPTPNCRVLIVDDEPDAREMLHLLLREFFPSIEIIGMSSNIEEAMQWLSRSTIDLVFLDVEMPGGSGFDFLSRIPERQFQVIFVTAFDQYAIKAIKAAAFDYLLKPVNEEEFRQTVNRALGHRFKQQNPSPALPRKELQKIALPDLTGFRMVEVASIVRCEADNNYTRVYFQDGSQEVVTRTLARFEDDLKAFGFLRIHHKHLINLEQLAQYSKGKGGGWVTLVDQSVLEVSVRRKAALLQAISPPS